jgi:hypothetical protein
MNTLILILCVGGGPFSSAIGQAAPVDRTEWVTNLAIELPVIKPAAYARTAPTNYVMPMPSKSVALWCPQHGYRCGMQRAVEDLVGHLQSVHGVTLELCNEIGRENWRSYHDDLHWCEENTQRQQQYLNPQAAKPAVKSGCGPNGCPTGTGYLRRGLFR